MKRTAAPPDVADLVQIAGRTDTTTTRPQVRDEESGQVRWRCAQCRTEFRGTPRDRLLDARVRWRRDSCRSCRRTTFMEREGP